MERVSAYENLRGLVYAPFYLGVAEGLFRAAGVDLDAKLSPSGEETAAGTAAGRVQVAWGGPMRVMAAHDRDPAADLVCFGLAVARDPFLLIGPAADPDFRVGALAGKRLDVATHAPTPWLLLQEDLRRAGLDPDGVDRRDGVDPTEALDRLAAGSVDYVLAFEPWGSTAERSGRGAVVSAGATRGPLAFTSFYAPRRFVEERPAAAASLVQGLEAALARLRGIAPEAAAKIVAPWFPEFETDLLAASIARYQELDLWPASAAVTADGYVRLKSACISGGFIAGDPPYERLVVAP